MLTNTVPPPVFRRLRGYSFDPSLSVQLDTVLVNEAVFKIHWEAALQIGPVGEYLEIVDFDPASGCFYAPVDLNDASILAQDGLMPSESNPQFHQQMVYAVAMTTIQNFEKALGRRALWSSHRKVLIENLPGKEAKYKYSDEFYQRLRIYPHALRQSNAYYSPTKKALLFGYFPASDSAPGEQFPNGIVFTCLSHDIIAHETTHALLDGMHRRFIEDSQPDTLAFHEAFADIVALFQHFSFPEVLRQQIAKTRGDLASQSLLGQLAQQFGRAIGQYGALRDAIGGFDPKENKWKPRVPNPNDYAVETEPHSRGSILVSAVFEAFLSIYKSRVADLLRIASNGTGILDAGELHPDLVNRLADEAAKTSKQILNMCIRALDYCPPVDINFGDYLRAIITADIDLVPDDDLGYRIAFIEAFRRRGIYPRDIRTLSPESLCWNPVQEDKQQLIFNVIADRLRFFIQQANYLDDFPLLENVKELSAGNLVSMKERLISRKSEKWDALSVVRRREIWERFFDLETIRDFKKFGEKKWAQLSAAQRKQAEVILWKSMSDREKIYSLTQCAKKALHSWLAHYKRSATDSADIKSFEELTGLYFVESEENKSKVEGLEVKDGRYTFEVHSFRGSRRTGPDGNALNEVIISLTQHRAVPFDEKINFAHLSDEEKKAAHFHFRGGCTLILDLQTLKLKYVIKKLIDNSDGRLTRQRLYRTQNADQSLRATYFGKPPQDGSSEPFAFLHGDL